MNLAFDSPSLPMRVRFERPMTDAELAHFCAANEPVRVERDANGELIVMSPAFSEGGAQEGEVGLELGVWTRGDGRGKYFGPNAGFTLADGSVRMADASWVRLDRWNALTEQQRRHSYAPICPEFAIEVRSETDRLKPLQEKMEMWIGNGAELGWLIDPLRKVVEVYRAGESAEIHENPSSVQGSGPVHGFELVTARIWG